MHRNACPLNRGGGGCCLHRNVPEQRCRGLLQFDIYPVDEDPSEDFWAWLCPARTLGVAVQMRTPARTLGVAVQMRTLARISGCGCADEDPSKDPGCGCADEDPIEDLWVCLCR